MAIFALYLHLPFCRTRCSYCGFTTRAYGDGAERAAEPYVDLLIERLECLAGSGALDRVRTAYIGGGTPTATGTQLVRLAGAVRSVCDPVEFTCEANPESFTPALAARLADVGVTRISLGVQSLDDAELAGVGRIHTASRALEAIACAKRQGFSTSCDLICGLLGQTAASWEGTLSGIVDAAPDHVSVYPLAVEEGTALSRQLDDGLIELPDDDFQADCMERARTRLIEAGLVPYEVASMARPGQACRHNIAYWTGESYLGLGHGAASMLTAEEYRSLSGLLGPGAPRAERLPEAAARVRFSQEDDAGRAFFAEALTARGAAAEDLMLACRMTRGVSDALLQHAAAVIGVKELLSACGRAVELDLARWSPDPEAHPAGDNCEASAPPWDGLASSSARSLVPTHAGWLRGNELYGLFWDLAERSDTIAGADWGAAPGQEKADRHGRHER